MEPSKSPCRRVLIISRRLKTFVLNLSFTFSSLSSWHYFVLFFRRVYYLIDASSLPEIVLAFSFTSVHLAYT